MFSFRQLFISLAFRKCIKDFHILIIILVQDIPPLKTEIARFNFFLSDFVLIHMSVSNLIFLFCCVVLEYLMDPFLSIDVKKLIFSKQFYALWFRLKAHIIGKFQFFFCLCGALQLGTRKILL